MKKEVKIQNAIGNGGKGKKRENARRELSDDTWRDKWNPHT